MEADLRAKVAAVECERDLWRLSAIGAVVVAAASVVWAAIK